MADPAENNNENEEFGEGEEEYVDPEAGETIDPEHPILSRVQETLQKQLTTQLEDLVYSLKEKREALRNAQRKREELGVELYGVQQSLAKLQNNYDTATGNYNTLKTMRERAEEERDRFRIEYEAHMNDVKILREQLRQFQMELDTVNATLGQVDLYNDEMKDQIAVTRRATYKAEEELQEREKEKKRQDLEIDRMNEQLKRRQEEMALYEAQLIAQREETTQATATISESVAEMEAIRHEKKQLLAQWRSSVIGMARRDEALQLVEEAVKKIKEEILSRDNEINGLKKAIKLEAEKNERLAAVQRKTDTEVMFLETQVQGLNRDKEKHKEDYATYQTMLEQTDQELAGVLQDKQGLASEKKVLDKEAETILQKQQEHENEATRNLTAQVTLKKGAQSTAKASDRIRAQIHETEIQVAQHENELSRVRVDVLNTKAHNVKLQENLQQLLKELKEAEEIANKYQVEIARRNDLIEKKQTEVDRLNKRLDQLASSFQDENTGPLEATIHNLQKSIAGKEQESTDLQNFWLRSQKELVELEKKSQEQADLIQEHRSKLAVLRQRKLRLDNRAEDHKQQIKQYEQVVRGKQLELERLNRQIAGNESAQRELADENMTLESKFRSRLKEGEAEATKIGQTIENLMEEKTYLLSDVVEAERQIMLWEKKIQLAKETQNALDPEVGAAEVTQMKKEIHRMKLRLESLMKKQEQLVQTIEQAVIRREFMRGRGRATAAKTGSSGTATKGAVKRETLALTRDIRQQSAKLAQADTQLQELTLKQTAASSEVERKRDNVRQMQDDRAQHLSDVAALEQKERENQDMIARYRRYERDYYERVEKGTYKAATKPEIVDAAREKHRTRRAKILSVVGDLKGVFPGMTEELEQIIQNAR